MTADYRECTKEEFEEHLNKHPGFIHIFNSITEATGYYDVSEGMEHGKRRWIAAQRDGEYRILKY